MVKNFSRCVILTSGPQSLVLSLVTRNVSECRSSVFSIFFERVLVPVILNRRSRKPSAANVVRQQAVSCADPAGNYRAASCRVCSKQGAGVPSGICMLDLQCLQETLGDNGILTLGKGGGGFLPFVNINHSKIY